MTRERLERLSFPTLKEIAEKEGINYDHGISRQDCIDLILEAMEEEKIEREHLNNLAIRVEEKKYDIIQDEELETQEKNDYPIPERYNETKITLLLRGPLWAFAYWDIKDTDVKSLKDHYSGFSLVLRVHETREKLLSGKEFEDSFDIPVTLSDNRWYLNLPRTGSTYYVELIGKLKTSEKKLCRSKTVKSARATIAGSLEKGTAMDSNNDILALSGLYNVNDSLSSEMIPQRIISLLDAKVFSLK